MPASRCTQPTPSRLTRRLGAALLLVLATGCGGGGTDTASDSQSLKGQITEAEFAAVSAPGPRQLLEILQVLARASAWVLRDPDALARSLFDSARDGLGRVTLPALSLDERFRAHTDRLSREAWRLVLRDPLRGVIAAEAFDAALARSLGRLACSTHAEHAGSITDAHFQALWFWLLTRLAGGPFAQAFADAQAERFEQDDLRAMFVDNSRAGRQLARELPEATQDQIEALLATSPRKRAATPGNSAETVTLHVLRETGPADGDYRGRIEERLTRAGEPVALSLLRCDDRLWARLRLLTDADTGTRAEWRLSGQVSAQGRWLLDTMDGVGPLLRSTETCLCRDLRLDLAPPGAGAPAGRLVGTWEAANASCPLRGAIDLLAQASPG
ncbi:MAG: hypothetical protein R3E68_08870 [Burkholderiaceae bacterium]